MKQVIWIAGGSGAIGRKLQIALQEKYKVIVLSRSQKNNNNTILWNPDHGMINSNGFPPPNIIINLAGSNITDARWTKLRKEELLNSRINSTRTLVEYVKKNHPPLIKFINASAIGFYGKSKTNQLPFTESDPVGHDFLAILCCAWENELSSLNDSAIEKVILRTGIVLNEEAGAFKEYYKSCIAGINPIIGNGKQYCSWIHIDDLINTYLTVIENKDYKGIINAVSPNFCTTKEIQNLIASEKTNNKYLNIRIPNIILKIIVGDLAQKLLSSAKVIPEMLNHHQFKFKFPNIESAIVDLSRQIQSH